MWEALRDPKCELELQGENFGSAQYSLAMRRTPAANEVDRWPMHLKQLVEALSHRLLLLHETGVIEHLDNRWILGTDSAQTQTLDWNLYASTAGAQGVGQGQGPAPGPGTTPLPNATPPVERQARHGCVTEDHKSSSTLEFENIASVYYCIYVRYSIRSYTTVLEFYLKSTLLFNIH